MKQKERFYEIDLFRFMAAISVVFYHYTFRGYAADNMSPVPFLDLSEVTKYGFLGIDLFFMISGFVILLTAYNRDFKGFIISRITRLFPAFWFAVSLTALTILLIGGSRYSVDIVQYLANLTMVSGYFGIKPIDDVYWTLLVEINFYVLIGTILLLNQIKNIKYYLIGWLLLTTISVFVYIPTVARIFFMFDWSSYFIAGAVLFLIRKEGFSINKLAILIMSFGISIKYTYDRMLFLGDYYHTEFSFVVIIGIIFTFYLMMFLVAVKKTDFINKKVMMSLGVTTYPLYLIHENIGFMVLNVFGNYINKYILLISLISFMLYISYLINKYIEKRYSKKLRNTLYKLEKPTINQDFFPIIEEPIIDKST